MISDETYERYKRTWEEQGKTENPDAERLMQIAIDDYVARFLLQPTANGACSTEPEVHHPIDDPSFNQTPGSPTDPNHPKGKTPRRL